MKINPFVLTAALFSLAAPVFGDTFMFSGDTTAGSLFNRPTEPGDALSEIGTAVPYFAQTFTVGLNGNYNFLVTANNPSSFDTFAHLYSGLFNPSLPLNNLVIGNDDRVNGSPDFGSGFIGLPLIAGNSYTFVIDGFGNSDFGAFSASISGPGVVSAVPEPASSALAGLGIAGLWLLRWRKCSR